MGFPNNTLYLITSCSLIVTQSTDEDTILPINEDLWILTGSFTKKILSV